MVDDIALYVGLDVSKEKIAIGLAEAGRKGEVRYYGEIANRADGAQICRQACRTSRTPLPLL